jgi:hypothetical protein
VSVELARLARARCDGHHKETLLVDQSSGWQRAEKSGRQGAMA